MSNYWQFAQLSEKYRRLRPMDQISQAGKLFIGGLRALDVPDRLEDAGITHILSVLDFDYCDWEKFSKYKRMLIQVEDHPRENLIQYFEQTNSFIEDALRGEGTIIVHCAMGVSRSATMVCAYLMKTMELSPEQALELLRKSRPLCSPNDGFAEQLEVYHKILQAANKEDVDKVYSDWLNKRPGGSKI